MWRGIRILQYEFNGLKNFVSIIKIIIDGWNKSIPEDDDL